MERREAEVCVVGAGFAGLAAARALINAGNTVVVFEARDRVAGQRVGQNARGRDGGLRRRHLDRTRSGLVDGALDPGRHDRPFPARASRRRGRDGAARVILPPFIHDPLRRRLRRQKGTRCRRRATRRTSSETPVLI